MFLYLLSCRQPLPNLHDEFIRARWKQAVGSLIHCVAGDATAIILMAALLSQFDITNGYETVLEYAAAYLFGLLIFQALFMKSMYSNYWTAVRKSIFAETVSMNFVMTGMFPIIVVIKSLYPVAGDPLTPYFWGMMSLATIAGFILAYPINSWMVKRGIKHGMMSKGMGHQGHMEMSSHQMMQSPSHKEIYGWVLGTFFLLFGVMWLVAQFVPFEF